MIPPLDAFVQGVANLARRYNVTPPDRDALERLLIIAEELADADPRSEASALFFVVASRGRALRGLWRQLARLVARNGAAAVGLELDATAEELDELRMRVATRAASYEDVRAWFMGRLR